MFDRRIKFSSAWNNKSIGLIYLVECHLHRRSKGFIRRQIIWYASNRIQRSNLIFIRLIIEKNLCSPSLST